MLEIGTFEAKNKFSALLDRVEKGEEIAITRHGKVVARMVPNTGLAGAERGREALERIRRARAAERLRVDWAELKQDRDEGRR